ncbi:uncharacterized protein BCR38DRAFT_432173 [Pseudomassariella vexata]|uniref:Uncharacterized protein n=1 Tax=Pseudomassariella vexata TaxID=1141098 RepID=A0A1Y2E169_9PEZI|nr:uncharacterized protein BCR38DRAFT_432173 [Pseudomassariella vexata]ORY65229.1 hypothetical protein BCR38DRAFT_432173 [Pseudomassariella vexata]
MVIIVAPLASSQIATSLRQHSGTFPKASSQLLRAVSQTGRCSTIVFGANSDMNMISL